MQRRRVGILLYPDVEVLDFAGPFEVLSVCRLEEGKRREEPSPFDVVLVAEQSPVVCTGGLRVLADHTLEGCPPLDLLLVPGGWGSRREVDNERLVGWIRERSARAELTTSVCTGSFLLAQAGLLEGKRATTHVASLERMRQTYPGVTVDREMQVVEAGQVITSAGISAGIDLALLVVARYHGEAVARATARHMEYPYPDSARRRVEVGPA